MGSRRWRDVASLNVVSKRYWYFALSLLIIIPRTIWLATHGLRLGTDFTGGTEIQFDVPTKIASAQIDGILRQVTGAVSFVQPVISSSCPAHCQYIARTKQLTPRQYAKVNLLSRQIWKTGGPVQQQTTSGTISVQLSRHAIIAVVAAAAAVLLYISVAFRTTPHPFRFGASAIIAMLHDVLVVLGIFSILGALYRVEVDATFVIAMLTIIGFSVHDTIVIFDRIRENLARRTGEPFEDIVNHSILQSYVRSITTSFTVALTLLAVFLFSGQSIRYFVLAMLIGIISGTYSSIFNASQILVVWHDHEISRLLSRILSRDVGPTSARAA